MRNISVLSVFLSILILPSAYAGCISSSNMNNNYFFPPSVAIEVNILQSNITTETMDNERIGSVAIEFTCPYSLMGGYWGEDDIDGGDVGRVFIALNEFNYTNSRRMDHRNGLIYIAPDSGNTASSFSPANGNSWGFPNISFTGFSKVMEGGFMTNQKSIKHKYAIYIKKMAGNVPSKNEVVSLFNNPVVYTPGGVKSMGNRNITPTIINNSFTLKYTNTVTCSVTSNVSNLDLGVVNIHKDLNTPLATIVLSMKCGLGVGGGNMTSNYPSFIIAGSARMNAVSSTTANNEWLAPSNSFGLRIGNGWGLRFQTGSALNINTLNNISIPIYPYKSGTSQGNSADWNGAVTFEISYN